jgi:hypothetical protein
MHKNGVKLGYSGCSYTYMYTYMYISSHISFLLNYPKKFTQGEVVREREKENECGKREEGQAETHDRVLRREREEVLATGPKTKNDNDNTRLFLSFSAFKLKHDYLSPALSQFLCS